MEILKPSALTADFLNTGQNRLPLFICTNAPRAMKKIEEANYETISVNGLLSKALLEYPAAERPKHIEMELNKILSFHVPILITDFEMIFDPRYEIDVVKFFCEKARTTNIAVKWPGKFIGSKLTYAEPECQDYHEYNCSSYQITIVQ